MGNEAIRANVTAALRTSYSQRIYEVEKNNTGGEGLYSLEPGIERLVSDLMAGDEGYRDAVMHGEASFDGVYERYRRAKIMLAVEEIYLADIIAAEGIPHTIQGIRTLRPQLSRLVDVILTRDSRFQSAVLLGEASFNDVYSLFLRAQKEPLARPRSAPPGVFNVETPAGVIYIGTDRALANPDAAFQKQLHDAIAIIRRSRETSNALPRLSAFVDAVFAGEESEQLFGEHVLMGGLRVIVAPFLLSIFDRDVPYGRVDLGDEFSRAVAGFTHPDALDQIFHRFTYDLGVRAGHAREVITRAVAEAITASHDKMTLPQGVRRDAIMSAKTAEEAIRRLLANPDELVEDAMLAAIQRALQPVDAQMSIAHKAFDKLPMSPMTRRLMRTFNHVLMEGSFLLQAPAPSTFSETGETPLLAARNEAIVHVVHGGGLAVFSDLARLFGYRSFREGEHVHLEVTQHGRPPNAEDAAFFSVLLLAIAGRTEYLARHNLPVDLKVTADYDALRQELVATFNRSQPGHVTDDLEAIVSRYGKKATVTPTRGRHGGVDALRIAMNDVPPTLPDGSDGGGNPELGSEAPETVKDAAGDTIRTLPRAMRERISTLTAPPRGEDNARDMRSRCETLTPAREARSRRSTESPPPLRNESGDPDATRMMSRATLAELSPFAVRPDGEETGDPTVLIERKRLSELVTATLPPSMGTPTMPCTSSFAESASISPSDATTTTIAPSMTETGIPAASIAAMVPCSTFLGVK